jgi:small conductance mechanosensitive channel
MKEQIQEWSGLIGPWLMAHGWRILVIILGGYILNLVLKRFIVRIVRLSVTMDQHLSAEAEKKREDTLIRIFTWTAAIVILVVVVMMVLQEMGVAIGPILAGAGIVGLAVGFGGQYLIRDLITGFFMILENQYRIGDVVRLDQTEGTVEDISLRMTTLRDLNGTVHHVPHGDIKRVSNLSKVFARVNLNIGVAYGANLDQVISVVNRIGNELAEDDAWKELILKPPQFLRVEDFSDSAVTLKIVGETIPNHQWAVTGELRKRLKHAFDQEGIEIPFPQRVIHHYTHER